MEELRLNLYAYKILDICWFEGELPPDPDTRFGFNINPAWPDEWEFPGSINGITHLSKEELQFITRRLKRPAWVREIEMISLSQILDSIFKHRSDK